MNLKQDRKDNNLDKVIKQTVYIVGWITMVACTIIYSIWKFIEAIVMPKRRRRRKLF